MSQVASPRSDAASSVVARCCSGGWIVANRAWGLDYGFAGNLDHATLVRSAFSAMAGGRVASRSVTSYG